MLIILYNRSAPPYTFTKNLHLHFAFAKKELNNTLWLHLGKSQTSSKKSLHPSRRMAREKLRHGVAVNFLSPRKKIWQSLTNKCVPIKFYKISKNNSVFILLIQNKDITLHRNSKQTKTTISCQPLAIGEAAQSNKHHQGSR